MIISLYFKKIVHHYQNITIVKELQKCFGEIYLEGKKIITTDLLFIISNIRIDFQVDAAEFWGLLYRRTFQESDNSYDIRKR